VPHQMSRGGLCDRPDGHKGQHRSRESHERRRNYCAEWQEGHPESRRESVKRWKENSPKRALLVQLRFRSKRASIPFNLTADDIPDIPSNCPCCDVEIAHGTGAARMQSPSLDRIIPARGYVKGNIQWLCWRCNRIKCDATPEELMKIALFMKERAA
jgi:hypothetical protein